MWGAGRGGGGAYTLEGQQSRQGRDESLGPGAPSIAGCADALPQRQARPAAHRGFWSRAEGIPIEHLFEHARQRGKRLVLCGHSLGAPKSCTLSRCSVKRISGSLHAERP